LALSAVVTLGVPAFTVSAISAQQRGRGEGPAPAAQGGRGGGGGRGALYTLNDPVPMDRALQGAFDLHAHLDPDSNGPSYGQAARSDDIFDMAIRSKAAGMRGFNIMGEHMEQTAGLAYLVRKLYPGVEAFGGMANNLIVGQTINPWTIIHMTEIKGGYGRFVELATWDSEFSFHEVRNYQSNLAPLRAKYFKQPFIAVAECSGGGLFWANYPTPCANADLRPETKQALQVIATQKTRDTHGDLILQTGHNSREEDMMLVKEALKDGVKTIVVSHPMLQNFEDPAQVKEIVSLGPNVWVEFTSQFGNPNADPATVKKYIGSIRAAGVEHSYVSSDTGQLGSKYQPDALADVATALRKNGFTEHEIDLLFKINPAKILGVAPPTMEQMGATR
jgi:hypothetical protein